MQKRTVIKTVGGHAYSVESATLTYSQDMFGGIIGSYRGKPVHCDTGPAIIADDGSEFYYIDGRQLTRHEFDERLKIDPVYMDLPNGGAQRSWRHKVTGLNHRIDGPAIETSDGSLTAWIVGGRYHRVGAPAVIISTNNAREESYYYNGRLHNPDGPAKINHLTKRNTYYLNGKRLSRRDFFLKQRTRSKMKEIVAQRIAYSVYAKAYSCFKNICTNELYRADDALPIEIHSVLETAVNAKTVEESRAGALAIYHVIEGRAEMTEYEFNSIYASLQDKSGGMTYVLGGTDVAPYVNYLGVFLMSTLDRTAIFTTLTSNTDIVDIMGRGVQDSSDRDVPLTMSEFSGDIEADNVDDGQSDSLSWTLPLALAAGATMLGSLYKKKFATKKKIVETKSWLSVKK